MSQIKKYTKAYHCKKCNKT